MDQNIREFYSQSHDNRGETDYSSHGFYRVIALLEAPDMEWSDVQSLVPGLVKGWFELSFFSPKDRVEFVRDYWLSKMPYHPKLSTYLVSFFDSIEDIGIYLTQKHPEAPFQAELVYSIKGHSCFYRGALPADDEELAALKAYFSPKIMPPDHLSFLQIHNGFYKTIDKTGILKTKEIIERYDQFQQCFQDPSRIPLSLGDKINPFSLIPFYESFGMPYYQCFWAEWFPNEEMGNVYYSYELGTISSISSGDLNPENMSFNTFSDWLIFYLEQIT